MKKTALFLVFLLSLSLILCCCGEKIPEKDEEKGKDTVKESEEITAKYNDGVVLEAYLYYITEQFCEDTTAEDIANNEDLLLYTARFMMIHRSDCTISIPTNDAVFAVSGKQLEKHLRLLFGEDLKLSDYSSCLDHSLGDRYDAEGDIYTFSKARESWGKSTGYSLSYEHPMDIEEDALTLTAQVTLTDGGKNTVNIAYTFDKIIENEYLYYRLSGAKVQK